MNWTELHAKLAAQAFTDVLGQPSEGSMAFVRCFAPKVVEKLAADPAFVIDGWNVYRVANASEENTRTVTADQAVELREAKGPAVLLLVDTEKAGAGMDGIYSAAQEIDETTFFERALSLAGRAITKQYSGSLRRDAELALRRARRHGRYSVSPWVQFDYLVRVAAGQGHPGELLHILGMWPAQPVEGATMEDALATSRFYVERLLGPGSAGLPPGQRIRALDLLDPTQEQLDNLERFLRRAATRPIQKALADLTEHPELWVNVLRMQRDAESVRRVELLSWRTKTGRIAKWSGLILDERDPNNPPFFIMDPKATSSRSYSKLQIRWQVHPSTLAKGTVQYQVRIVTDMEEEIAVREVTHAAKRYESCYFTNDDFSFLDEDALVAAKVVVSVVGNPDVDPVDSEEIFIKFGDPPEHEPSSTAKRVRTLVDGLIELNNRDAVTELISSDAPFTEDAKGFVVLRTSESRKNYKAFRPPLLRQVEEQWAIKGGPIGRWRVQVRMTGECAGPPEFIPLAPPVTSNSQKSVWERVETASRRMAERFARYGGVAQIYDERAPSFNLVKEYLLGWAALLEEGEPYFTLANTVEVQTQSGRTIGLIVLPSHPLRMAWHAAYDNLVLCTAFEHDVAPKDIHREFALLDGSMFPAFLPGLSPDECFIFADTLGFHAVGMVPHSDKEPKAAIAILARAMGESETADSAPTVGHVSATVLGKEIKKYLDSHNTPQLLHLHALRPGDGLTVARALSYVRSASTTNTDRSEEDRDIPLPSFVLELYPSERQKGLAGRYIAEIQEKRRRAAGVIAEQDRWMLDSGETSTLGSYLRYL